MKKMILVLIILAGFFPAILAIVQYIESNKKEAEAKINEADLKNRIDSLNSKNEGLVIQMDKLSKDNLISKQEASEAQAELKKLQIENLKNLGDLTEVYKQNAALEKERGKYLTGGNSVPVVYAKIRFYAMDPFMKWSGPQNPAYINKWICEFKIENWGNFPLTNIRSFRTTQGANIKKDVQQYKTVDILGPKETKEFQPTDVYTDPTSADRYYEVKVEWQLHSYSYILKTQKDVIIQDSNTRPMEIVVKNDSYVYKGRTGMTKEELVDAIQKDLSQ